MPPKIRDLIQHLKEAGFIDRGVKGSHRNFTHLRCGKPITISGNLGEDVKPYQERQVQAAIEESRK